MAHNDNNNQHDDDVELVSKSQLKREMTALQELGAELIPLDIKLLEPLGLPERLVAAIREAKRLKANGAVARHKQYIGKLMRDVDPEPIRALLARIAGQSDEHNAWLHKLERIREKMLTEPKAVEEFVAEHPTVNVQHLRQLIRNAVKEREQQKPPKAFRELFQLLKEQFAQPVQPNPDGTLPDTDEE